MRGVLAAWRVMAGLGDNHASAVGCGIRDSNSVLVSAGTSGTIGWVWPDAPPQESNVLGFSFYEHCLWLLMLGACGASYRRFLAEFASDWQDAHHFLNGLALHAPVTQFHRVEYDEHGELYRPGFLQRSLPSKIASVQFSIALELVRRVKQMRRAMPTSADASTYVLTGGLSQSECFQRVFHAGIQLVAPDVKVMLSGRSGPLRYKTTAYGALINAESQGTPAAIPSDRFPLVDCAQAGPEKATQLRNLLAQHL